MLWLLSRTVGYTPIILLFTVGSAMGDTWLDKCDIDKRIGSCSASVIYEKANGEITVKVPTPGCISADIMVDNTNYPVKFVGSSVRESITIFDKSKQPSLSVSSCDIYAQKQGGEVSASGDNDIIKEECLPMLKAAQSRASTINWAHCYNNEEQKEINSCVRSAVGPYNSSVKSFVSSFNSCNGKELVRTTSEDIGAGIILLGFGPI